MIRDAPDGHAKGYIGPADLAREAHRLLVLRERDGWVKVRLPSRPNDAAGWLPRGAVRRTTTRWALRIDLRRREVQAYRDGRLRRRFGAVVGAPGTPTPTGRFAIFKAARQPDPGGFLGPWALHLTAHSDVLFDYGGGLGRVAIHGRAGASLLDPLGSARSHGCVRVRNAAIEWLQRRALPGTPVEITRG